MSENFTRRNADLERRIAEVAATPGATANDIQTLLSDVPVDEVLRGAEPEKLTPADYAPLRRVVEVEDNGRVRRFLISGGSDTGLDLLEAGIRRDVKFGLR